MAGNCYLLTVVCFSFQLFQHQLFVVNNGLCSRMTLCVLASGLILYKVKYYVGKCTCRAHLVHNQLTTDLEMHVQLTTHYDLRLKCARTRERGPLVWVTKSGTGSPQGFCIILLR